MMSIVIDKFNQIGPIIQHDKFYMQRRNGGMI